MDNFGYNQTPLILLDTTEFCWILLANIYYHRIQMDNDKYFGYFGYCYIDLDTGYREHKTYRKIKSMVFICKKRLEKSN